MRDKAEELRREKLALVREQVKNGTLVIRKMTAEERALYPPRTGKHKRVTARPRLPLN